MHFLARSFILTDNIYGKPTGTPVHPYFVRGLYVSIRMTKVTNDESSGERYIFFSVKNTFLINLTQYFILTLPRARGSNAGTLNNLISDKDS